MKIAIYTLPKSSWALGGEDQMATFMAEELSSMGVEVDIYYPHEAHVLRQWAKEYDCLISNSVNATSPVQPAGFWHFNESFKNLEALSSMGYTHVFTNSSSEGLRGMLAERTGLPVDFVPLAAPRRFARMQVASQVEDGTVGYIGNYNEYKESAVRKWLVPLSRALGKRLKIWGGMAWTRHELRKHYQGVLATNDWGEIPGLAQHWINFRSEEQALWQMMNDRVYWLLAIGARYVHTDPGGHDGLPLMVSSTPDQLMARIQSGDRHPSSDKARSMIEGSSLYHHRVAHMLKAMGIF